MANKRDVFNKNLKYDTQDVSQKEGSLRYASSDIGLTKKIRTHIGENVEKLYWYLRFNLQLDEKTVNSKNMRVTDLEGYSLKTEISYSTKNNIIVILPIDSYEKNCYYILNISGRVKSIRGTPLRKKVTILFKLGMDGQIESYNVLKNDAKIPAERARPYNYEYRTPNKVTDLDKSIFEALPQDKLPHARMPINLWLGFLGLVITIGSIATMNVSIIIGGLIVALFCLAIIIVQLTRKKNLSIIHYNIGASRFNKEQYGKANISFQKSILYDEYNEMAEIALGKIRFYL